MKKITLCVLLFGISVMCWTPAIAKKDFGDLDPPSILSAAIVDDAFCVTWEAVSGAVKYSVDVDVNVDEYFDDEGILQTVVEFSFGTGDQTDPAAPNLCVPLADFTRYTYDENGDPILDENGDPVTEQVSGTAHVKVKALNPGKGKGRQNHKFSEELDSSL